VPLTAAAVLIDMQQDVVRGRWWTWWPDIDGVVARCVELANTCRAKRVPVIYTAVEYQADGSNTPQALATGNATPTEYLVQGTPGTAIVPELAPMSGELVAVKNLVSGFDAAGLSDAINAGPIDTILLAGLAIEGGVKATMEDAHARGLRVILVSDCCAAFSESSYQQHVTTAFPPLATVLPLREALTAVR
jgi:nicotinamidase-related amidase